MEGTNNTARKKKRPTQEELVQILKARANAIQARINTKKRKKRNHRLYQIGYIVDKYLGEDITPEQIEECLK